MPFFDGGTGATTSTRSSADGENAGRAGYRPLGIAGYIYREFKPGTVPLYRYFDPVRHQHFYTLHPHAEFAK